MDKFYIFEENATWIFSYEYYNFNIDKQTGLCKVISTINNKVVKTFHNVFVKF